MKTNNNSNQTNGYKRGGKRPYTSENRGEDRKGPDSRNSYGSDNRDGKTRQYKSQPGPYRGKDGRTSDKPGGDSARSNDRKPGYGTKPSYNNIGRADESRINDRPYPAGKRVRRDDSVSGERRGKRPRITKSQQNNNSSSGFKGDGSTRLNKYIAHAGICSRREADDLIKAGLVMVNDTVVTEMGVKVNPGDVVKYNGEKLRSEKKIYILLNKPKDYVTTSDDPEGRKTVLDLVKNACKERVYPVGRLDRNTTGLLLLTNDGAIATRLTHPKYNVKKIYHIFLEGDFKAEDLARMEEGLTLEDGFIKPDSLSFIKPETRNEVGMEIHSGRNRIVRRMFEHLGYKVIRLDRVLFAGLTKKNLPRGKFRFLTEMEVNMLKMNAFE